MLKEIKWKLHLSSSPEKVFDLLSTDEGRTRFWAEESHEHDGKIEFLFPNGSRYTSRLIQITPDAIFKLEYFNSIVSFYLIQDEKGGTDLTLRNTGVSDEEYMAAYAGWISVLLNLKAVADHDTDLRNHDKNRTWDQLYIDN